MFRSSSRPSAGADYSLLRWTGFLLYIEAIAIASFLSKEDKQRLVRLAVRKTDTLKVLLLVLLETKSIDDKKYIALSLPIDEMGKMLGG